MRVFESRMRLKNTSKRAGRAKGMESFSERLNFAGEQAWVGGRRGCRSGCGKRCGRGGGRRRG